VIGGVDFLRAVSLGEPSPVGREVVVIGGGNVAYDVARTVLRQIAYDAARSAARLGGKVRLVSLETLEEMPADTVEIREGDEEGVERLGGFGPIEILRGDGGQVRGVRLQRCLRVYDGQRRFAPVFDAGDQRQLGCDTVLIAAGQAPDVGFLPPDIEQHRPGWPKVDPQTLATTAPGVFAAGDLAHGTRLLIDAVASGKRAARSVYRHVTGRALAAEVLTTHLPLDRYLRERGYERLRRKPLPVLHAAERLRDPKSQVELRLDPAAAAAEAGRCLDCGVTPVFDGSRCVLCGGCADVCPTQCLKLAGLDGVEATAELAALLAASGLGPGDSAILKDEERCIRCSLCAVRCPVDAISMERVRFTTDWSLS
jgi:formate dehydrogenase beta subunit